MTSMSAAVVVRSCTKDQTARAASSASHTSFHLSHCPSARVDTALVARSSDQRLEGAPMERLAEPEQLEQLQWELAAIRS